MVFDKGQLQECGKPSELLRQEDSMFAEMARHAPGLKAAANSDEDYSSNGADDNSMTTETGDDFLLNFN